MHKVAGEIGALLEDDRAVSFVSQNKWRLGEKERGKYEQIVWKEERLHKDRGFAEH